MRGEVGEVYLVWEGIGVGVCGGSAGVWCLVCVSKFAPVLGV